MVYGTAVLAHAVVGQVVHRNRPPAADWLALTDAADCCVTPVLRLDEVTAHPWFTGSQACGGPR